MVGGDPDDDADTDPGSGGNGNDSGGGAVLEVAVAGVVVGGVAGEEDEEEDEDEVAMAISGAKARKEVGESGGNDGAIVFESYFLTAADFAATRTGRCLDLDLDQPDHHDHDDGHDDDDIGVGVGDDAVITSREPATGVGGRMKWSEDGKVSDSDWRTTLLLSSLSCLCSCVRRPPIRLRYAARDRTADAMRHRSMLLCTNTSDDDGFLLLREK